MDIEPVSLASERTAQSAAASRERRILTRLASVLRALRESEPQSKPDLASWQQRSQRAAALLTLAGGAAPHWLWHYLADADIRLKDADYAAIQRERLMDWLRSVEGHAAA